jgi:hypothetical protein
MRIVGEDTEMNWKQIEIEYGKSMTRKIKNNKWMKGITISILPNGEEHIPQEDIERALKDIRGEKVTEWD